MLLVQLVRFNNMVCIELLAQVSPRAPLFVLAIHRFHEIVRLPSDAAQTAQLHKKIVVCSA
jgi:hypothetical protein